MSNTARLTLRLTPMLAEQIRQKGGSNYVRGVLEEALGSLSCSSDLPRSKRSIEDERELLNDEWEAIKFEREELKQHDRLLWRKAERLDQIRWILASRREQLDDEWEELEELRSQLHEFDAPRQPV